MRPINNKFNILLELSDSLFEQTNKKRIPILLSFVHDYTKVGDHYLTIGYGQFDYHDYLNPKNYDLQDEGLIIKMSGIDLDIKEALNLINASIENIDFIKNSLMEYKFYSKYYGEITLKSISMDSITAFKNRTLSGVKTVLESKIYRNIEPVSQSRNIDYYFQNNKFHFYNTREPSREWNQKTRKNEISNTYSEVILSVENVTQIVGDYNYGHFVFLNDSVFHYLPQLKDKVFGPLTINGIENGHRPIRKPLIDFEPIKRFTLSIGSFKDSYQKVLYVPDSSLVISHFEKIENDFLSNLIKKRTTEKEKEEEEKSESLILGLLLLSLAINLILILRKRNKANTV